MPVPESIVSAAVFVKDFAGAGLAVGALAMAIGFSISPPWPARADVEQVQKSIQIIQDQQTKQIAHSDEQSCIIYQLLKDRYLKEQADAEGELIKNPASTTLQRARDEAQGNVIKINLKLNAPPCA